MVREMMDMLGEADAEPEYEAEVSDEVVRKLMLAEEVAKNGEAILTLIDGSHIEVHNDDTHFYPARGVFFTEEDDPDGDEAESWYFAEDVISVQRH